MKSASTAKATLANYDREWDVEVPDDADVQAVYALLLKKYN